MEAQTTEGDTKMSVKMSVSSKERVNGLSTTEFVGQFPHI